MSKDKDKRHIFFILGLLISIILFLSFIIGYINDENEPQKLESISYDIWIKTEETNMYTLIVPILVYENGDISEINNNFELVSGNASWSIEGKTNNRYLLINAIGDVWIKGNRDIDADFFTTTGRFPNGFEDFDYHSINNTDEYDLGRIAIELNSSSNDVPIELALDINYGNIHHRAEINELQYGWQYIDVKYEAIVP